MSARLLRRRHFIAAVVAASLVATTAGCASGSGSGDNALDVMIWDPAQKAGVQKAIDGFESANPKTKVSLEVVPMDQYYTKLDASLGAGQGPDVMWMSSSAPDYVDGGALESLSDYIKKDNVSLDAYPEKLRNLYRFDGKQYGIPKDQDAWTWVYNTAVFKRLGVTDLPKANWTWEDMVQIGQELKAKQSGSPVTPLYYDHTFNNGIASIVKQLGGQVVDGKTGSLSSTAGTKALQMVKDLQDQKLIPRIADSADFDPVSSLISGTLAMGQIPSWNLSLLTKADVPDGTFKVVRMPSVNGSWATDTNSLAYVMNTNSPDKDAAWQLIKFLTSTKGAELHAEGGASPCSNVDPQAQAAFVKANAKLDGLGEALTATHEQNYLRTSTQYTKTRPILPAIDSSALGPYYAGSLSVTAAASKVDAILDKALK